MNVNYYGITEISSELTIQTQLNSDPIFLDLIVALGDVGEEYVRLEVAIFSKESPINQYWDLNSPTSYYCKNFDLINTDDQFIVYARKKKSKVGPAYKTGPYANNLTYTISSSSGGSRHAIIVRDVDTLYGYSNLKHVFSDTLKHFTK